MLKFFQKKGENIMLYFVIIVCAVILILLILNILVHVKTKKRDFSSPDAIPIGGMISSNDFDYSASADKKVVRSPIVRLMQLMWIATSKSDAENHSKQTPPEGIKEINNIRYINDNSVYHLFDVYYPENTVNNNPVIIDIHGGGWMYGDKELNKLYCLALASRGYTVFNISYSLVPDVTVDVQIKEVMTALKYIGEHIDEYPADKSRIILTGDSAGGQLAAYACALTGSRELRDIFETDETSLSYKGLLLTSPVASMNCGGYMSLYMKRLWGSDRKNKKCYNYMNFENIVKFASFPKTYLITSAGDFLAHVQTNNAYSLIKATGAECRIADFGGEQGKKLPHVFTVINPYDEIGKKTIDDALNYLNV